ncbi:hypothetical protein [Thalassomonas actiniarum]|uniref:Uncharacterized protein n=1 Tax=Thalassomonas actiniarum TaxID=485447 RepID=A0AAE9YVB0_9GAMM|nr:hypothetical protein [Thalassomonas actiniarum]WDE00995.1 hypothetical protein SG35_010385 [Thalassomonas actiniarum]
MVFEVLIDGKPLSELALAFEATLGDDCEGGYVGALGSFDVLKNAVKTTKNDRQLIMPLMCECGRWECAFIVCRMRVGSKLVRWSHWQHDYRDESYRPGDFDGFDYSGFTTLVFEKSAYMQELKKAQRIAEAFDDSEQNPA